MGPMGDRSIDHSPDSEACLIPFLIAECVNKRAFPVPRGAESRDICTFLCFEETFGAYPLSSLSEFY